MHSRIILAGSAALSRLSGESLTCLATFSRSLYLKNSEGRLVCLLQEGLEPGPLNALCAPWPGEASLPAPGTRVFRHDGALHWPGVSVRLDDIRLWSPPPPPSLPAGTDPLHALPPPETFLAAFAAIHPDTDFAPLFAHFLAGAPLPEAPSPLLAAGANAVAPLVAWLRGVHTRLPGQAASPPDIHELLGLGPGLTPSGDDILGGAMIALCLMGRHDAARALYAAITALPGHTNAISMAHLELAAAGQGAEAVHLLLGSLLRGEVSHEAARRVDGVGHSSGWDMVLGALLAVYAHP